MPKKNSTIDPTGLDLTEQVVSINRTTKVVKGGKNLSFAALVVVGDGNGNVGWGLGKAREVPLAIAKGIDRARRNVVHVTRDGPTIPHATVGRFGAGQVVLRPASPGTGVIAGGAVRAVLAAAGVGDILTKSLGSRNPYNLVKATIAGLVDMRSAEQIAEIRGLNKDAKASEASA